MEDIMEARRIIALLTLIVATFLICSLIIRKAYEIRIATLEYDQRQMKGDNGMDPETASEVNTNLNLRDVIRKKGLSSKLDKLYLMVDILSGRLTVYIGDQPIKNYPVVLGKNTMEGDKEVEGDYRTPRGEFYICQKAVINGRAEIGTRWMRLSYPNIEDAKRGLEAGIITQSQHDSIIKAIKEGGVPPQRTPLGGGIGIHGGAQVKDSTQGCISLYDKDVEELYELVNVGTRVIIID
jgi:lipoprotein-anchoring transpeptidase ErfK/SrfK